MTLEGYRSVSVACVWLTFPDEPTQHVAMDTGTTELISAMQGTSHKHINVRVRTCFLTIHILIDSTVHPHVHIVNQSPNIATILHVAHGPLMTRPSDLTRSQVQRAIVRPGPATTPNPDLVSADCIAHGQFVSPETPCKSQ